MVSSQSPDPSTPESWATLPTSPLFAARIAPPRTSHRSEGRQRAPVQGMPRALGSLGSRRCSTPPGIARRASLASTRTTTRGSGSPPRGPQPPRVPQSRSPPRQSPLTRRAFVPRYASPRLPATSARNPGGRSRQERKLAIWQPGNWAIGRGRRKRIRFLPNCPVAKLPSSPVAEAPRQPSTPRVRVATITSVAAARTGRRTTSAEAAQARRCSSRMPRSSEPSSRAADRLGAARFRSAHNSADSSRW
jgi:hypothetical protein